MLIKQFENGKSLLVNIQTKRQKKKHLNLAKKQIKSELDEDAIIKDEKILHKSTKNGKVILDIHFKIIENIAVGQPIFQGDT